MPACSPSSRRCHRKKGVVRRPPDLQPLLGVVGVMVLQLLLGAEGVVELLLLLLMVLELLLVLLLLGLGGAGEVVLWLGFVLSVA